jgi:hypothetical protein
MIKLQNLLLAGLGTAALAGCATVEEKIAERAADTYRATLLGSEEVGGGDADGIGSAEISISDEFNQVCWDLNDIRGIGPITAAHIHRGVRGTNGPPVFSLRPANEGGYKGCASGSEWTQDRIEGNPSDFYVNVHTAEYPAGAIRGQLNR